MLHNGLTGAQRFYDGWFAPVERPRLWFDAVKHSMCPICYDKAGCNKTLLCLERISCCREQLSVHSEPEADQLHQVSLPAGRGPLLGMGPPTGLQAPGLSSFHSSLLGSFHNTSCRQLAPQ